MADPKYQIYYFPVTGRAELPRLILEVAGVPYENKYPADWPKEKSSTPFGQLPCLKFKDASGKEHTVGQSAAIVRYLAHTHGLVHDDPTTVFLADSLNESWRDMIEAFMHIKYRTPEAEKPAKFADFKEKVLPGFIAAHTKYLEANGNNGYYFGTKLTYLELNAYFLIQSVNETLGKDSLSAATAPALLKVHDTVAKHPKIVQYVASSRLHK